MTEIDSVQHNYNVCLRYCRTDIFVFVRNLDMYLINLLFKWSHQLSLPLLSDQSCTDRFEIKHVLFQGLQTNRLCGFSEPSDKHASHRVRLSPFIYAKLSGSTHDQSGKYMWNDECILAF